jgi:hypothetical protein
MTANGVNPLWSQLGETVRRGTIADRLLHVGERYTGAPVEIPIRLMRGPVDGPVLLVTAAIHGDELNGVGIVRKLMLRPPRLLSGGLVLIPVVNVLGMERHSRYVHERRDLNRAFPGSSRGSLSSRIASSLFRTIVRHCDQLIDLHTATNGRTNFPHVRADLEQPGVEDLAFAFGCEVVVDHRGNAKTLRTVATRHGIPSIVFEGGEALKVETSVVELGLRGVENVLMALGLIAGEQGRPAYQTATTGSRWLRAKRGGFLRLHVTPGQIIDEGVPVGTIDNLSTGESVPMRAPIGGVVIGLRTLPAVKPGDPICHIASPRRALSSIRSDIAGSPNSLHRRVEQSQRSDVSVEEP